MPDAAADPLEKHLEAAFAREARVLGWLTYKIERANVRGLPDRVLIRGSRTVWVELKRLGRQPTDQQKLRHAEMRAAGAEVYVVDSMEFARVGLR